MLTPDERKTVWNTSLRQHLQELFNVRLDEPIRDDPAHATEHHIETFDQRFLKQLRIQAD